MGELSPIHWLIVLAIILLLFGGRKIPELAKGLGEGIRSFKQGMSGDIASNHSAGPDHHAPGQPARRTKKGLALSRYSRSTSRIRIRGALPSASLIFSRRLVGAGLLLLTSNTVPVITLGVDHSLALTNRQILLFCLGTFFRVNSEPAPPVFSFWRSLQPHQFQQLTHS